MSAPAAHPKLKIVSNRSLACFAQIGTFITAFAMLLTCIVAATKFASSPFEVFLGIVLGGILATAMVVLGIVLPSTVTSRSS